MGAPVAGLLLLGVSARAQEIEPRAYANAPVSVNFLIAGYAYTQGGIAFDPALPVTDPELETSSAVLAYARGSICGDPWTPPTSQAGARA